MASRIEEADVTGLGEGMQEMQGGFEWSGCLLGLLGAFLLATHTRVSRYGWLAFLAANVTMIVFAALAHHAGLLAQQAGFMASSLLGLRRAGLWPGRRRT